MTTARRPATEKGPTAWPGRHQHWRDVEAAGSDAVTTIEMAEHVGDDQYPDVARLCLVGGSLAFEQGRRGVDQILARRPADAPATPVRPEPRAAR